MTDAASLLTGSTRRLLDTFLTNGIACEVVDGQLNLIRYKTKHGEWRLLKWMLSEKLPLFSKEICDDKWWTSLLFEELDIPAPATRQLTQRSELREFIKHYGTVVIKPRKGAHGHGVSTNITSKADLLTPIRLAKEFSSRVLMQQQVAGADIRLLVIGDEIISALERRPAAVSGDAIHTVRELVEIENERPQRGQLGIDTLVAISLPAVKQFLTDSQLQRIPARDEIVRVVGPSNQSMGGTVHDVIESIPSSLRDATLRITRHLQMPIAGVDCIMTPNGYYFLEINASPGIAIHDDPALGILSGCFKTYMQLLHDDEWWQA